MALPTILAPAGTPVFLAEGHAIALRNVYAPVRFAKGTARQRRVVTAQQRIVAVEWLLSGAQMADVEQWYEQTLDAGAIEFSARVANQGAGLLYWRARWLEFQTEMMHLGRGRVSGKLLLTGTPQVEVPT